jgi:Tol biopolymer transport system component/DNA-binding winged helix-turn-helix (wHTH) protein
MSNSNPLENNGLYTFSVFRLDKLNGLYVAERPVKLAPKVLQTLIFLVENQGRVVTKDELFENVWADTFVEDNALSFNISQLRKALAKYDNQTIFVETVPKRGFRFNADVVKISRENVEREVVYEKHQIQEVIIEDTIQESAKLDSLPKFENKTRVYLLTAVFLSLLLGGFAFWHRQKNADLRSFDSSQTKKLTSWKSTGSNIQTKSGISNNGNLFAYSSVKKDNEEIFIKQLSGGEDIQVTQSGWNSFSPVWSPDDRQIAFVSVRENQVGIYTSPSLGGNSVLLKIIGTEKVALIKWSNDNARIYYELSGNLFALNLENKEVLQITNFPVIREERYFSFSADETQIAFCEKQSDQTDILAMQFPNGTPFQITNDKDAENNLVWHPDGKRIFYGVNRNGHNQINVAYTDKSEPLQITRSDDEYRLLDVSADGTKVFYVSQEDKSDVWSVETADGNETKITKEDDSEFWADESQDGKFLSYQTNPMPNAISKIGRSLIVIKDKSGFAKDVSVKGFNQKWLPDSRRISFLRWEFDNKQYNIWTFDVISGEEKQITTNGVGFSGISLMPYNRNQTKYFDWSNNGDKVIYTDSKLQNVMLTSTDPNETINLAKNDNPNLSFYNPIWSKDGKIIFVSILKPENADEKPVLTISLFENGKTTNLFSTGESLRLLGFADDEIICLATADIMKSSAIDAKLLRISTSGQTKLINTFEQISVFSSALSPDGKKIAFTKRADNKDDIYFASTNTKTVNKITANSDTDSLFGSLNWSSDSKTIFYDKQEKINIISVIENLK